jgi:hypothetical protein
MCTHLEDLVVAEVGCRQQTHNTDRQEAFTRGEFVGKCSSRRSRLVMCSQPLIK